MSFRMLLEAFRERGIEFWYEREKERLHVEGPLGAITPEIDQANQRYKKSLIWLCLNREFPSWYRPRSEAWLGASRFSRVAGGPPNSVWMAWLDYQILLWKKHEASTESGDAGRLAS